MGVSLSWLAVQSGDRASLLTSLKLVESGTANDEMEAPLACAEFPEGWLLIVSQGMKLDLGRALPLASQLGTALGCEVEEHVMFSRLRAYQKGARLWAITHDPDATPDDVRVEGEPPPLFRELHAELAAEQASGDAGVDYMFDLPVRLGQRLCGYAHDRSEPRVWTVLERAPGLGSGRSFWRRLKSLFSEKAASQTKDAPDPMARVIS